MLPPPPALLLSRCIVLQPRVCVPKCVIHKHATGAHSPTSHPPRKPKRTRDKEVTMDAFHFLKACGAGGARLSMPGIALNATGNATVEASGRSLSPPALVYRPPNVMCPYSGQALIPARR
jgi:hypothetical protein